MRDDWIGSAKSFDKRRIGPPHLMAMYVCKAVQSKRLHRSLVIDRPKEDNIITRRLDYFPMIRIATLIPPQNR